MTAAPDARLHARQCPTTIAQFFAGYPGVLALIAGLARRYLGGAGDPAPQLSRKRREAGTHAQSDRAGRAGAALPRPVPLQLAVTSEPIKTIDRLIRWWGDLILCSADLSPC